MRGTSSALRRLGNPAVVLAVADATILFAAFYLGSALRFALTGAAGEHASGELLPRAIYFVSWILLGLLSMGLYRGRQRPRAVDVVVRVTLAIVIGGVCNIAFFSLAPAFAFDQGAVFIALGISLLAILAVRLPLLRVLDDSPIKRRVMVIGAGDLAAKLKRLRRKSDRRRFDVIAFVAISDTEFRAARDLGLDPLVMIDEARSIDRVDEIVVALDDRRGTLPVDFLLARKQLGTPISDIVDFLERETERIDLDVLKPSWLLYENSSQTRILYRAASRLFDLVFSSLLLTAVLPLLMLVMVAIRLEDGPNAPIFYRQRRVGCNGKVFRLIKFRSMRVDAEQGSGPRFASTIDDRVTSVGRFMRRFRIDELPQLVNVIKGDMSVVGPRPERPEFVEELAQRERLYFYRHCVRPGLTGWAQINFPYGASLNDAREKLKYDLYYVKNATLVMDLLILLQTVEIVIWGHGTSMSGGPHRVVSLADQQVSHAPTAEDALDRRGQVARPTGTLGK